MAHSVVGSSGTDILRSGDGCSRADATTGIPQQSPPPSPRNIGATPLGTADTFGAAERPSGRHRIGRQTRRGRSDRALPLGSRTIADGRAPRAAYLPTAGRRRGNRRTRGTRALEAFFERATPDGERS